MRTQALAVGLVAMLSAAPASAGVLLDTLHNTVTPASTRITNPSVSLSRGGPLAMEFSSATNTTISQVQLQLTANNPSDGGSVLVYIVPNAVGGPLAGNHPAFTGTGSTLSLTDAVAGNLIGTIADSLLPSTAGGSLFTLPTSFALAAGDYWLALVNTVGATAKWVFDSTDYNGSTGITGKSTFWQAGATGGPCAGAPCTFLDTTADPGPGLNNLYEAAILTAAPEPASLAVLGLALTGLGIARRRRSR